MNRYFAALWRSKWLIIAITLVTAGATWYYSRRQPVEYKASGLLQVGRVWKDVLEDPYVVTETINGPGFAHKLASMLGLKPNQIKKSIHATTLTAGPVRSSYPILVQVTATTGSAAESSQLAQAVMDEVLKEHSALFDQAIAPHLAYQRDVELLLANAGFMPDSPSVGGADASPNRTPTVNGHAPSDEVIKLERELQDVRTANTAPTFTDRSRIVDKVVATGSVTPEVLRPTVTAAFLAFLVAVVCVLALESLPSRSTRAEVAEPDAKIMEREVRS